MGTASPLLVAEGAELFAVLDNPAFEGVDPVGVGEAVAEFRGLSEASCNLPVEQQQVVVVSHGHVSAPSGVAEDFRECDSLGHHQQRRGRTWRGQGLGSRVPAGVQLFEDGIGEAVSVPVVMPLGDDPCCAAKLLARPGGVVDGGGQPLESAVSGDDLDVVAEIHLVGVLAGGVDPAVVAATDRRSRSTVDPDVGMTGNPGDALLAVPSDGRTTKRVDQRLCRAGQAAVRASSAQAGQRLAQASGGAAGQRGQPGQRGCVQGDVVVLQYPGMDIVGDGLADGANGVPPAFRTADQIGSDPERTRGIDREIREIQARVS